MNTDTIQIVQAAQQESLYQAALAYEKLGFSVLPLKGKRPICADWKQYQDKRANAGTLTEWNAEGKLENIGLVCGAVSGNLVVLDLDGAAGYPAFAAQFPELAKTYTVATGGGIGRHVYWLVEQLPEAIRAMGTPIGNLEICANGRQVVAPPSIHPVTHQPYKVDKPLEILKVPDLKALVTWVDAFKAKTSEPSPRPMHHNPNGDKTINRDLIRAIESYFIGQGYKWVREWLHGTCIYPHKHKHGDRNPSFGFNVESGYAFCHVCGTILAKDVCDAIGLNPTMFGGLLENSKPPVQQRKSSVKLSDAPKDSPQRVTDKLPIKPPSGGDSGSNFQPDEPVQALNIDHLTLPNWLQQYLDWAGTTGNETPMTFHLEAGLWLLSVAIGRRLYAQALWGVKIFPNLYLMMIGGTTYYRKSTAYKLAEQIAREAIPHMLMPTPGSPERFQESLAGKLPQNFKDLTEAQQKRLKLAQPFAAQRGLLKDEVAGLFGAINKRDYMVGLKDMLMELYNCPDYSDKDTQTGLTIVENAALSILGVTTPASLSTAVSDTDWSNGLLIRFGLLTPEDNYQERPAPDYFKPPPPNLISDLRRLHDKLPQPKPKGDGFEAPTAIELDVACWQDCRAYGEMLRQLCNPKRDNELDERLKGVYGRMHVQALKLAELLAALDWLDEDSYTPTVTQAHWESAKAIAEQWRLSAARLLTQLDTSHEAQQERRDQDRMVQIIQKAGQGGIGLRDLYRKLNLSAKRARQMAHDLVKAGLIVEQQMNRAEWFMAAEFLDQMED